MIVKPFNLQIALQGDPAITRDGRRVMYIKCSDDSPFLEVTADGIGNFFPYKDGSLGSSSESSLDLFMAEPSDWFWPFPYDLDKHVHHGIGDGAPTGPIKETPYAIKALQDAAKIMEERGKQYDTEGVERSMAASVTMFNAATKRDLTESEGWLLMECLKLVRLFQRPGYHEDSAHDNIAYAALLAESKSKEKDMKNVIDYDGGSAFPQKEPLSSDCQGMTLLDYFAAKALEEVYGEKS